MNSKFLDKDESANIKGMAALFVMLGHLFTSEYPLVAQFMSAGCLWVGLFFFYSGYGVMYSYRNNIDYMHGFILNKIFKIYIPFVIAETIYTISYIVINPDAYSVKDIIADCLGVHLLNGSLWYVVHILLFYFLFYIIQKCTHGNLNVWLWLGIFVVYLALAVGLDIGNWWYISSFALVMGVCYLDLQKWYDILLENGMLRILIVCGFAISFFLLQLAKYFSFAIIPIPITWYITFLDMVTVPFFVMLVWIFTERVHIFRGVIMKFLGKNSYEIYIYHLLVLLWLNQIENMNLWIKAILLVGITCIVAKIMNGVDKKIMGLKKRR